MEEYRKSVLTRKVHGYVYVERTQMDGTVRQGLVGAVDLDAYDYAKGSKPAIRPSESTVVERIPPRLKVRRGATLETPHVMMLADDADCTLIEPIGLMKNQLPPLYDGELMLGGGHLRGWAVEDPALIAGIDAALAALADPAAFARRWPAAKGQQPMVLAVGDGNHSLATAKAYWEELKPTLSEEQRRTHPARWCLAEVCNVHSPAIEIEPIHRVVFGVGAKELYAALDAWDQQQGSSTTMSDQRLRLADAHGESAVALANPPAPLTVGILCVLVITLPLAGALALALAAITLAGGGFAAAALGKIVFPSLGRYASAMVMALIVGAVSVLPVVGGLVTVAGFVFLLGYVLQKLWQGRGTIQAA